MAATKFMMSAPVAIGLDYSVTKTIILLIIGGWLGTAVFYYAGGWVTDQIENLIRKVFRSSKPKKRFTKGNRRIIKIKNAFGIWGITLLTPSFLSIPIGCVVAARYYEKDKRTVPLLFFFTVVFAFIYTFFWNWVINSGNGFFKQFIAA